MFDRRNLQVVQVIKIALTPDERRGRNVNRAVGNGASAYKMRKNLERLVSGPRTQLDDHGHVRHAPGQFAGMLAEQACIGSRQAVLGEKGYRIEQSSTKSVIEVFRVQLLLRDLHEAS